jgi:hypothetical protein
VAMAEAMLCGCVPLIGDSDALAEVAGRWAVRASDHPTDVAAIGAAAGAARTVDRADMRRQLGERFSLARRTELLETTVDGGGH